MYFVVRIAEEPEPALGLVEGFGDEDEVGAVLLGGLNANAPELDCVVVSGFGFWIGARVLPRMWVMVLNLNVLRMRLTNIKYIIASYFNIANDTSN